VRTGWTDTAELFDEALKIAISPHIYGTDITRTGSSARRYYS
jgi:hypothetical protein